MQTTVTTAYQPVNLVAASAGAGKTFHIQKTLLQWINGKHVQADRILAVTFTQAAAAEMRERIRRALLNDGLVEQAALLDRAQISTIHALGLQILQRFCYAEGASPEPRQLTDAEQEALLRSTLVSQHFLDDILSDLERFGFTGEFTGSDYITDIMQFREQVLVIINRLRQLKVQNGPQMLKPLQDAASDCLRQCYGDTPFNAKSLNKNLWQAVEAVRKEYPDKAVLMEEWGSNEETREMVEAIYAATKGAIEKDWNLWVKLQSPGSAKKIFGKNKAPEHKHADMAFAIWEAADQLSRHPGPLQDALQCINALLESAQDAIGRYQQQKTQAGLVDYADMVQNADSLLENEAWLEEVTANYDCLIVDEFQDTNPLQFALLWRLARAGLPMLVVGDVKQSIMGFQGADPRIFESLLQAFPDNRNELPCNWRSSDELVSIFNQLGTALYGGDYHAVQPKAGLQSTLKPLHIIEFDSQTWGVNGGKNKLSFRRQGPQVIADHIAALLVSGQQVTDRHTGEKRQIRASDIAVLARTNSQLERYASALQGIGLATSMEQPGWFESPAVQGLFHALQYLADPRDRHAALYLSVVLFQDITLQDALLHLLDGGCIQGLSATLCQLDAERDKLRFMAISTQVQQLAEITGLWERAARAGDEGRQQRANLLKLVAMAETFETLQPETLQVQYIHGKSLSAFLAWLPLAVKQGDQNKQPDTDVENTAAVHLSTWHSSKGLEWPVVVVASLEDDFYPDPGKKPDVSVQYQDEAMLDEMLDKAWLRIVPTFKDKNTRSRYADMLHSEAEKNLKNLLYVVMTRAREQLILPWFEGNGEQKLCARNMLEVLEVFREKTTAPLPEVPAAEIKSQPYKAIGRAVLGNMEPQAGRYMFAEPSRVAQTQPGLANDIKQALPLSLQLDYNAGVNLDHARQHFAANEVGDQVHRAWQAILVSPGLRERLIACLPVLSQEPQLFDGLLAQVGSIKHALTAEYGECSYQAEVPLLAGTDDGTSISGIIDLLVKTPKGWLIIDHKTDWQAGQQGFDKHCQQLAAYAAFLPQDMPLAGVGINWVQQGILQMQTR